jgi:type I restriction enzyme S subunit
MIVVEPGDLVISGINVAKGAIAVHDGNKPIAATIHYSCYIFDKNKIDIAFFKRYLKSPIFVQALENQVKGGIKTEIKAKHLLPIMVHLPNMAEQQLINSHFESFEDELASLDTEFGLQSSYMTRLRKAILQEAIEGKLTVGWRRDQEESLTKEPKTSKEELCARRALREKDPDFSARALLSKIMAEKEELVAEGKIKKQKPLAPIKPKDAPFALPEGWIWTRFGHLTTLERGRFSIRPRNDKTCFGGKYPFIQIGSLSEAGHVINDFDQTLNDKGYKASKEFPKGTILVAIVGGTIGNLGVLGRDMCFPDSIIGIRPSEVRNNSFTLLLMRHLQPAIRMAAYQMAGQPNIKIPTLAELIVAVPPLAEQKAIVERVEELLSMVDELEKQVAGRKLQTQDLLRTVLAEAFEA